MAPWGELDAAVSAVTPPPPYADYEGTVRVLAARGVRQDFQSDAPLRHIHRRVDDADIYFVANPAPARMEATCLFRTTLPHVALWDAARGRIAAGTRTAEADGRARVSLALEPHESLFVVFTREPDPAATATLPSPPALKTVQTLDGPWDVAFQPGRGAPEKVTLAALTPWNEHAEEGVRHFSGVATYRKVFDLPPEVRGRKSEVGKRLSGKPDLRPPISDLSPRFFLDLGAVEVMARVRLNGKDLGVVWTPPLRVDITDALGEGGNDLEIEVANLWPNRLIADQALPQEKRISWTTWNPYKKDSPLLPSGLLGPVTVLRQTE
jgi:hypothetical protein